MPIWSRRWTARGHKPHAWDEDRRVLLAIDTASQVMSLALHDGHQIAYEASWRTPNNHTTELTPAIQVALKRAGLTAPELSGLAVAQGPGSFTGLRIGLGVAKGLAQAVGRPLVAIPSLDIVAAAVPPFDGALVVVLQAGRGRVCAGRYAWDAGGWRADGEPVIAAWPALIEAVEGPTLFAGEVDERARALLQEAERPIRIAPGAVALRRAGYLAELAWARIAAGQVEDAASITPIYLHQPGVPHP